MFVHYIWKWSTSDKLQHTYWNATETADNSLLTLWVICYLGSQF